MPITVRSRDGKIHSLEDLIHLRSGRSHDLDGKIEIKKGYFRVSKKMRKNYAIISYSQSGCAFDNSDMLVSFSEERNSRLRCSKLKKNGIYHSMSLSHIVGEGIFDLKEYGKNSYKIIQPKK